MPACAGSSSTSIRTCVFLGFAGSYNTEIGLKELLACEIANHQPTKKIDVASPRLGGGVQPLE